MIYIIILKKWGEREREREGETRKTKSMTQKAFTKLKSYFVEISWANLKIHLHNLYRVSY